MSTPRRGFPFKIMGTLVVLFFLAIAAPAFLRTQKRSASDLIQEDLRLIDEAVERYAIEHNQTSAVHLSLEQIKVYLKPGTELYAHAVETMNKEASGSSTPVPDAPPGSR